MQMQRRINTQVRAFGRVKNQRTVEELNAKDERWHLLRTVRPGSRGQVRRSGAMRLSRAIGWRNANWGVAAAPLNPVQRVQQNLNFHKKTRDNFQVQKMAWISVPFFGRSCALVY